MAFGICRSLIKEQNRSAIQEDCLQSQTDETVRQTVIIIKYQTLQRIRFMELGSHYANRTFSASCNRKGLS